MIKELFYTSLVSVAVFIIGGLAVYNFMPYEIATLGTDGDMGGELGATITTINATDRIKDSRSVINTNFANLNSDKLETTVASVPSITTLAGLTSASSLATIGTITTGTWNADILTVSYGGTGASTLTSNEVLLGNGTGAIQSVSAGSDGQILTLSSGVPTWESGTLDLTGDYAWTGVHSWTTGTTTFNSKATFTGDTIIASTTITQGDVGYPTASSSIASKGYVDEKDITLNEEITEVSSSAISRKNDTVETAVITSTVYYKVKELTYLEVSGTINVNFSIKREGGAVENVYGRVYVNGLAVGTERTQSVTSYIEYNENISVEKGDLVQMFIKAGATTSTVQAFIFELRYDIGLKYH